MKDKKMTGFPFHYIDFPNKEGMKKPFLEQVERVLGNDIQKADTFGCKINDCHTHAGSKIHFNDFVEAELLFHNSNYNRSFAQLTCDWIFDSYINAEIGNNNDEKRKNILLISYEKYSELYLQELKDIIKEQIGVRCGYCVYETVAETQPDGSRKNKIHLRNFSKYSNGKIELEYSAETIEISSLKDEHMDLRQLSIEDTLCIFIVPINTTLSTMDKMVAKFYQSITDGIEEKDKSKIIDEVEKKLLRGHICLITLFDDSSNSLKKNDYWTFDSETREWLRPVNGRLEYLQQKHKIRNLVAMPSEWSLTRCCKKCYPTSLTEEKPMFGVNRGSVVPMLKVGTSKVLAPIDIDKNKKSIENLRKVCSLSENLTYKHTSRGDNHYQYYLNTDKFIKSNRFSIENYLGNIRDTVTEKKQHVHVFDYIVAPRHESNAEWVHLVHKKVFKGAARIIYFDVEKEYRSNLKAKYSDLICGLINIKESNQDFLVRFHFVDDTIQSGANFLRAKNLITSLTNDLKNVKIFDSVFILVNRLSIDNQKFYSGNVKRFFYYVDVKISPMRSYEDACTLCKLIADYYNIRNSCATNKLAELCTNVINRHRLSPFSKQQLNDSNNYNQKEKKLVFFITHLLNERLANNLALEAIEKSLPIDSERNSKEIEDLLFLYYRNGEKIILKYTSFSDIDKIELMWKVAFIKAISRPFFTYHIRQRQAAFTFCLKTLNKLLDDNTDRNIDNCILVQSLVKALADLNANYLIRYDIMKKLFDYAKKGDEYKNIVNNTGIESSYYKKSLFTSEALLHYIKKNIVLSRDTTKSLLLEYSLVKNDEGDFFEYGNGEAYTSSIEGFVVDNFLTMKAFLYLENNVILKDGLTDTENVRNLKKLKSSIAGNDYLYFFSNLNDIWKLNTGKELKSSSIVLERYDRLTEQIKEFAISGHESRSDLSKLIDSLFDSLNDDETSKLQTIAFVYDNCESNPLFQFFTLSGNPVDGTEVLKNCRFKDIKTSQAFFYDKNLEEISCNLYDDNGQNRDIFFIKDHLTATSDDADETSKNCLIVRFGSNSLSNDWSSKRKKPDESIYMQIWGFDEKNICHWFSLKLLLTLRESFAQLIDKVNLQELVEERKIDAQKAALAIKKATTHAQCDKYYKLDFFHENSFKSEQFYKYYIESEDNAKKVLPILYDKYIQLLSDDFLASIYKRIINNQDCFKETTEEIGILAKKIDNVWFGYAQTGRKNMADYIDDLFALQNQLNKNINITLYKGNTIDNVEFKVKIKLDIPKGNWENCSILCWSGEISSDMSLIVLFILMIVNAAEHGKGDDIEIIIADDGIYFINKMRQNKTVYSSDEIENNIEKNRSIPPWVMEKQHLTLWTLYHARNIDGNKLISPKIEILQNDNEFIYKIKIDIIRNN